MRIVRFSLPNYLNKHFSLNYIGLLLDTRSLHSLSLFGQVLCTYCDNSRASVRMSIDQTHLQICLCLQTKASCHFVPLHAPLLYFQLQYLNLWIHSQSLSFLYPNKKTQDKSQKKLILRGFTDRLRKQRLRTICCFDDQILPVNFVNLTNKSHIWTWESVDKFAIDVGVGLINHWLLNVCHFDFLFLS